MRVPVVTGLGRAAGTSTVAAALHGHDAGLLAPAADIVVCGGASEAFRAAEQLRLAPFGHRPVLAVTHPGAAPAASRSRVEQALVRFPAVVLLPLVPRWQAPGVSTAEVAELLALQPEQLPAAERAYAEALRALVAAVLGSRQLVQPMAPVLIRPAPAPSVRPHLLPLIPARRGCDLDDEQLERAG